MKDNSTIEKIEFKDGNLTWIVINNPDQDAADYLKKTYRFHPLDLEDCLSDTQRPKIDDYEDYLFIVMHVPVRDVREKHIRTSEIDIFIGQNYLITLHNDNPTIQKVFENCKKHKEIKEEYLQKGSGYLLYQIINDLFESCNPLVDGISREVNHLEVEVFHGDYSRDRLKDILMLKKDIINFRRIIMPQRPIIAQLEHKNKKFLPEKLDVYFDDIVDTIERMWNMLENLQELAASIQETNESIISHNTSNVIKILTVFSVIMLPLTFVTGFYGMNLENLPLSASSHSVLFVSGIIFLIAVTMLLYFRYKKWL